jgi:hypothetical protein
VNGVSNRVCEEEIGMKLLALNGSPRKGWNSCFACKVKGVSGTISFPTGYLYGKGGGSAKGFGFGYCETLYSCDTYQYQDYSKMDCNMFDEEKKAVQREKQFNPKL